MYRTHCTVCHHSLVPDWYLVLSSIEMLNIGQHGATVSAVDENRLSPLMLAVQKGLVEESRLLLTGDPTSLNMRAEDGSSALMLGYLQAF